MNITLLDGRSIPTENIRLEDHWDFFAIADFGIPNGVVAPISAGERLTYKIKQADKRSYFPSFDAIVSNDKIYQETSGDKSGPKSTNTTGIFVDQILTDPLDAPAEAASKAVDSAKAALKSPWTWAAVGLVVVVLVVVYVPRPR